MITKQKIDFFQSIQTPFYFYDLDLLRLTLNKYTSFLKKYKYEAHYAMKANAEPRILHYMGLYGLGADCVSGEEVKLAIKNDFNPKSIVYAGVGKSDKEIKFALKNDIFCFNCESSPEIEVINAIAASMGKVANISLRVNPNIDAHTHKYISTGREEDKFGISPWEFDSIIQKINQLDNIKFVGLHFHIGSQITDMSVFKLLCDEANHILQWFSEHKIDIKNIDLGGGLGVDYDNPTENPIPDFENYFRIINDNLHVRPGQKVHLEPGRALVAQCGHLISKVLYVKVGKKKKFVIIDAGMNDLIRPALYQAHHCIENLTSDSELENYEVVGPVCESSDVFSYDTKLNATKRGDIIAIHSTGAYGQVMAMKYNQRKIAKAYYSDDI